MTPKTRRIELRTDAQTSDLFARAARTCDESVADFVLKAACTEAHRVLVRVDRTIMTAGQFDEIMSDLDKADESTKLAELVARPQSFVRQ